MVFMSRIHKKYSIISCDQEKTIQLNDKIYWNSQKLLNINLR